MPLPSKRDHAELRARLHDWLTDRLPVDAHPEVSALSVPEGTGMSSETLLFSATWTEAGRRDATELVARMAPDAEDYPVFPAYDLALQANCLRLVRARTSVPVPEVLWIEESPEPLGAPFFVMRRIDGEAPPDVPPYVFGGWLLDASPEQQADLERNAVGVLAELHTIRGDDPDIGFLARPGYGDSALDQHLGYQRWYYEWARGDMRSPLIEAAFEWLDAHRPNETETVLNWGDARIGNILFRDFTPVAVLDWEMAALGPREVDVAWMSFLHRFFADLAERAGMPLPMPGFLDLDRVAALYGELSGVEPVDLEWYEAFAALRFAIISLRTSARAIAYGDMPAVENADSLIMHAHLIESMLEGTYWS